MKVEVDSVVNGEDTPEEVDKSIVGVVVCVTECECDVNDENVNEFGSIIMSTPARVSCIVHSVRDEEERTTLFHLKQCRKSSPSLETSSDRVGGCPAHRDEEVRRIQEMADLGPRRTRSRGIQDVTADGKSEVGPRSVVHVVQGVSSRQTVPRPVPSHVSFSWCCGRYSILPELELYFRSESRTLSS